MTFGDFLGLNPNNPSDTFLAGMITGICFLGIVLLLNLNVFGIPGYKKDK